MAFSAADMRVKAAAPCLDAEGLDVHSLGEEGKRTGQTRD